jgi:uncharacterized cupredoxin-like copper-binding protein
MKSRIQHLIFAILMIASVVVFIDRNTSAEGSNAAQTKTFHLYAADMQQEMASGVTLYSWGYGLWDPDKNAPATPPSVPGPELRVTEGDHVKVVFHNQQDEFHTIHFHGIDNSFAGDGTPGVSEHGTGKNETYTYEFDADHAGTFYYHCHVEPDRHPEMGLYGAFIVEPKTPKYKVDGEFTLLLAERDPALSVSEASQGLHYAGTAAEQVHLDGEYDTIDRKAEYYTINGKIYPDIPAIQVKEGGTYLIRLINAGSEVHTFHTHGHHFDVVASDGRDIANPISKDTITIGPGEKYDLLLHADNPGIWPIHCHIGPHDTHGMHMMMVYDTYVDKIGQLADMGHSGHDAMSPMDTTKHHMAMLKTYAFEHKYSLMKSEVDGVSEGIKGFYNLFIKDMEPYNELESSVDALAQQLKGTINAVELNKNLNDLDNKIQQLEDMISNPVS